MNRRLLLTLFIIASGAYAAWSLVRIVTNFAPDFSVFYHSAENILLGRDLYSDQSLFTGLGYPPQTAMLFVPFTVLPYGVAQGFWVIGSFVCMILSVMVSQKETGWKPTAGNLALASSLVFLAFPTRFTLGMGQVNFMALLLLLVSVTLAQKGKKLPSALALSGALLVKPQFLFFFIPFMVVGYMGVLLITLGLVTGVSLVTGFLFGFQLYRSYVSSMVIPLLSFHGREIYYNQNIASFVSRMFPPAVASTATLVLSVALVLIGVYMLRGTKRSLFESVAILMPVFLLVEPLAWQHHFVFLIPTFLFLWKRSELHPPARYLLVVSYMLISANIRNPGAVTVPFAGSLVLPHVMWGTVLVLVAEIIVLSLRRERRISDV